MSEEVNRPSMSMFATAADYNAAMGEWIARNRLPTKCCGKTGEPYPVMWNPGNAVVQCHICGTVYEPEPTADQLRAAIEQERERLAAKWEEAHGFDKHGVASAIRSGVKP